jgi:hypothetical protein
MTLPPVAKGESPERLIANDEKRAYARPWKAPSRSTLHDESKKRTAYSLRHSYICMRLMEGAPTSARSQGTAAPASK